MKNVFYLLILIIFSACDSNSQNNQTKSKNTMDTKVEKTEEEWKKLLSEEQYNVLREKGTEAPFSGKYYLHTEKGKYVCAACGNLLFTSNTKFDAGCGWRGMSCRWLLPLSQVS